MPRLLVTLSCALAVVTAACSKDRAPEVRAAATEPAAPPAPASSPRQPSRAPVQIEMKNVRLHADEGIVLEVRHLRGEMIPRAAGQPPIFDDQRSYTLRLHAADVAMDMTSLTNLMNHHIFAFENAPLSDITVEIDEGQLKLKGKLHKGLTVPISMNPKPSRASASMHSPFLSSPAASPTGLGNGMPMTSRAQAAGAAGAAGKSPSAASERSERSVNVGSENV